MEKSTVQPMPFSAKLSFIRSSFIAPVAGKTRASWPSTIHKKTFMCSRPGCSNGRSSSSAPRG
jgi:hypothetical protein